MWVLLWIEGPAGGRDPSGGWECSQYSNRGTNNSNKGPQVLPAQIGLIGPETRRPLLRLGNILGIRNRADMDLPKGPTRQIKRVGNAICRAALIPVFDGTGIPATAASTSEQSQGSSAVSGLYCRPVLLVGRFVSPQPVKMGSLATGVTQVREHVVHPPGLEPGTCGLRAWCSAN